MSLVAGSNIHALQLDHHGQVVVGEHDSTQVPAYFNRRKRTHPTPTGWVLCALQLKRRGLTPQIDLLGRYLDAVYAMLRKFAAAGRKRVAPLTSGQVELDQEFRALVLADAIGPCSFRQLSHYMELDERQGADPITGLVRATESDASFDLSRFQKSGLEGQQLDPYLRSAWEGCDDPTTIRHGSQYVKKYQLELKFRPAVVVQDPDEMTTTTKSGPSASKAMTTRSSTSKTTKAAPSTSKTKSPRSSVSQTTTTGSSASDSMTTGPSVSKTTTKTTHSSVSQTTTTGPSAYESMMIDPSILNSTAMAIGPSASKAEATHAAQGMVAFG